MGYDARGPIPRGGDPPVIRRGGPPPAQHGTVSKYKLGCRCRPCRTANAAYNAAYRARGPQRPYAEQTPDRTPARWRCATCGSLNDRQVSPDTLCGCPTAWEAAEEARAATLASLRALMRVRGG